MHLPDHEMIDLTERYSFGRVYPKPVGPTITEVCGPLYIEIYHDGGVVITRPHNKIYQNFGNIQVPVEKLMLDQVIGGLNDTFKL